MSSGAWWTAAAAAAAICGVLPRARADAGRGPGSLADDRTLLALAVALACSDPPAREGASTTEPAARAVTKPQLELVATVHARSLRFEVVPSAELMFRGSRRSNTVWKAERINLPMHPEPGVVYRDVRVRLTIASDPDELTSLLRDAKRASAGIVVDEGAPAAAAPLPRAR